MMLMGIRWAWQHTDDSRHARLGQITADEVTAASRVTIDAGAGKAKPRRRRTRRSMKAHLEDLHVLLRSTYFSSWPLGVRFFSADVYRQWKTWCDRVDESLPSHIQIILDGDCDVLHNQTDENDKVGSVHNILTRYTKIDDCLEKAAFLLDDPTDLHCKVCQGQVIPKEELVVVCPQAACHCISHMSCLSAKFLAAAEPDRFVPLHGTCPACKKMIKWPVIMQELTLRRRGDKELRSILRRKKRRENQGKKTNAAKDAPTEQDSSDDSTDDDALDENWIQEPASESDSDTEIPYKARSKPPPPRLEIVIEDSEDD